ncbi:MAG: STAS/SEC14 domain-containing protein [Propionibacteriales bacterium]|nr:STAS/SEC14 domain-containing protein [Propionibacteriales bacterium]
MLRAAVVDDTNIVEIQYSGSVTTTEMEDIRTVIDEAIAQHGSINVLAEYGNIELRRIEPKAYVEDLRMTAIIGHVDRAAVLSDTDWIRRAADAASKIIDVEVKSFRSASRDEALAWLQD